MIKMLTEHESYFRQRIMTVQKVADAICKQVLTQNSGQVVLPSYQSSASAVRAMPTWMQEGIRTLASRSLRRLRDIQSYSEQ